MNVKFVLAGHLQRDFILPIHGRPQLDVPGGALLYAACGATIWAEKTGLLARVGEEYPQEWLTRFQKHGWDTRGIHILPGSIDQRSFHACLDPQKVETQNPLAHFSRLGLPFPKSLLGYKPPGVAIDDQVMTPPDAPHPGDIPADYLDARGIHLCPVDYTTATRISSAFRQAGTAVLTLDPSQIYMKRTELEKVRSLLQGVTAFLPSEEELRTLFWGRTNDLWEMAEATALFGCEFVVVKKGAGGQMLYDRDSKKRWEIPAYPARVSDLTGSGSAFCGGFLAGYVKTFDPLQAVLHGNISASLNVEGSGGLHALDRLPGLAERRLESLATSVRQV